MLVRVDDVLLAVFFGMYGKPVLVNLLPGPFPKLEGIRLQRALVAEVLVLAVVAGALLGPPDGTSPGLLEERLEERDAGCDDDEVAFDAARQVPLSAGCDFERGA